MSTLTGYALELAIASGACRRCSIDEPKWHNEDPCPHDWPTQAMCRFASLSDQKHGRHKTYNASRVCDVCAARIARREAS